MNNNIYIDIENNLFTIRFSNIFITKTGMMKDNPQQFWTYHPNERHDYCIQYIISGEGTFFTNNVLYPIKKGDLFLIPNNRNYYYKANPDNPYNYFWIHFNGSGFKQYLDYINLSDNSPIIHNLYDEEIVEVFDAILKISTESSSLNQILLLSLGYKLLHCIASKLPSAKESDTIIEKEFCNKITNYLVEKFSDQISLDDLAEKFAFNKYHLLRIYKKHTGFTPIQFLINYRIKCACEMLKQGYAVKEAAFASGFTDIANFSVRFKKKMNISPNEFKKYVTPEKP